MLAVSDLFGTWVPVVIPYGADGRVDLEILAKDIDTFVDAGVQGVYAGGTTGEFYALEREEYLDIVDVLMERCECGGVPYQAGCTGTSTRTTIAMAEALADRGVMGLQVALPFWGRIKPAEGRRFLADLSAAVDLPLVHYNTVRAGCVLEAEDYQELLAAGVRLIGLKQVAGGLTALAAVAHAIPQISVMGEGGEQYLISLAGGKGGYSAPALISPHAAVAWNRQCREDRAGAADLQGRMLAFVGSAVQPLLRQGAFDPAIDKTYAEIGPALRCSRRVRGPHTSLNEGQVERIRSELLRWLPEFLEPMK